MRDYYHRPLQLELLWLVLVTTGYNNEYCYQKWHYYNEGKRKTLKEASDHNVQIVSQSAFDLHSVVN